MSSNYRLALDFDPRLLIVNGSPQPAMASGKPNISLDAVFIPTRGRPDYVLELLNNLPEIGVPIYLLPTLSNETASVNIRRNHVIKTLSIDDTDFVNTIKGLRCFANEACILALGDWDLPVKRNYALWHAFKHGFRHILFLDDDIRGLQESDLVVCANSLQSFAISGLFVDDFPDKSAVGHVRLRQGELVRTFLSGSCLFVRVDDEPGFFPPIYNEDWLFMLPRMLHRRVCSLGNVQQKPYDPFANPAVARFQEFGEIVAEGLFTLLANNSYEFRLRHDAWRDILGMRRDILSQLARRATDTRQRAIVETALQKCIEVTENDCVNFVTDWDLDRDSWRRALQIQKLRRQNSAEPI